MKKYSDFSMVQKSGKVFVTKWAYKEGVFETPQGKFIVRVRDYNHGFKTLCQFGNKEDADKCYEEMKDKFRNQN